MTVQPIDYGRFIKMADRLIARWGQVGTLSRPGSSGPSHNPGPAGPATTTPALFVVTSYDDDEVDGTRIKTTDKQVLVAVKRTVDGALVPLAFDPATTDSLIEADGGTPFKIIAVETIKPATVAVLHVLQVRR